MVVRFLDGINRSLARCSISMDVNNGRGREGTSTRVPSASTEYGPLSAALSRGLCICICMNYEF
jgi:hypothetical protein